MDLGQIIYLHALLELNCNYWQHVTCEQLLFADMTLTMTLCSDNAMSRHAGSNNLAHLCAFIGAFCQHLGK